MKTGTCWRALAVSALFLTVSSATGFALPLEMVPESYTFSVATNSGAFNYGDQTGSQLIDGQSGTSSIAYNSAYEWVAWYGKTDVDIIFNFGQETKVDYVEVGTLQGSYTNGRWDIIAPSIEILASDDGSTWTSIASLYNPPNITNNFQHLTYTLGGFSVTSQYFMVSLEQETANRWTFVDEINFFDPPAAAVVPEPGTLLLLGAGLLGLGVVRRQEKSA